MCNQNITFRELPPVPVSNEFQKDDSESGFNYTYLIIFAAVGVALVLLAMILFKMNKNHNEVRAHHMFSRILNFVFVIFFSRKKLSLQQKYQLYWHFVIYYDS